MDYYDSAEGLTITRKRALQELRDHNCQDFDQFFKDMGDNPTYSAQAVLNWLGYWPKPLIINDLQQAARGPYAISAWYSTGYNKVKKTSLFSCINRQKVLMCLYD